MQAQAILTQIRAFLRDENGGVAIEAAIIFPVGFFLVLGTLEMALYFFANSALNNAVKEMAYSAAQECRASEKVSGANGPECPAGAIKSPLARQEELSSILRSYSGNLIQLSEDNLCIRVQSVVPAGLSGTLGGSNQIMRYDFQYRWKFLTPLIGIFFSDSNIATFNASFLVRNGEIQTSSDRSFSWMNQCNGFAAAK